jgi:hypothetical protein
MLAPHSGKRFEISVGPCQKEIVLMKAKRGANYVPGEQKITVLLGNYALKQICLDSNFKIERHGDEIVLYKTWYQNGFVTLYQNNSKDTILEELIEYNVMEGLEVEDM